MSVHDSAPPVGNDFRTVLLRAAIFASFLILLSLLGEVVLVWALNTSSQAPVKFTTFWGFALSSGLLGSFPLTYTGTPLGLGLSKIGTGSASVVMTRAKRFAIFFGYLLLVIGLGLICQAIQQYEHVQNEINVLFLFPCWFLLIVGGTAISEWRRL